MPLTADAQRLWSMPSGSTTENNRMARPATAAARSIAVRNGWIRFIGTRDQIDYAFGTTGWALIASIARAMLLDSARDDTISISMAEAPAATNIYVHPQALCEATTVGENTRVWAFAHVLPGATIGKECNICDHVFIENDV